MMLTKERIFEIMKEAGLDEKKFDQLMQKETAQLSDEELEQVNGGFANSYMVQSIFNNGKLAGYAIRRYSFGAAWLKVFGYNHPSETVLIQGDEAAMKKWLDNRAGQFDSIYIDNKMYRSALI